MFLYHARGPHTSRPEPPTEQGVTCSHEQPGVRTSRPALAGYAPSSRDGIKERDSAFSLRRCPLGYWRSLLRNLPTGTVTFLFADIEASTGLLEQMGDAYARVLSQYRDLLRSSCELWGGQEVDTQGDACFLAFPRARDAVAAAVAAQRRIFTGSWPEGGKVRVRMGLHTGEPLNAETGYIGMDVHRAARIGAVGHGGQILLSQTTRDLVADELEHAGLRDLGEHRLKDLAHPQRLFQVLAADLPSDFPPIKSLDVLPNNLPRQLTSFIGREREIAEVRRLLTTTSLVTLTGAGGSGKTRLALQVAADVLDEYPDGVWAVELAALSNPDLVPQAVAAALGVPEQPGRAVRDTLAGALRPKTLLLILDNCEHLLAACADMAGLLLRVAPGVRILATSREPLDVQGEAVRRVPSLAFPAPRDTPAPEQLTRYEAVRLFVDRAVLTQPEFAVTPRNAAAIAQIVTRLDGIPLAIELAATRVKVLTVEQIAARLDDRFRLLTGGSRTSVPRHQTLRAAMDWSYELLSAEERTMLRRLAVFARGWTLEAAESICPGRPITRHRVLDLLTQLADKSLVTVEAHHDEARYRLAETVRQYALDRLLESREAARIRRRHRDWYLALAERAGAMFQGPGDTDWHKRLEVEHDNLRAALAWSLEEQGGTDAALRLAGPLGVFWHVHSHYTEGRQWLARALARSSGVVSRERGMVLNEASVLAWRQGDYAEATALSEEALTVFEELGDAFGLGLAHLQRGLVDIRQDNLAAATARFEKGLALARGGGEKWLTALAIAQLAAVARYEGHFDRSWALCQESITLFREVGSRGQIAYAVRLAGHVARGRSDLAAAVSLYKESLVLYQETENKWVAAECLEGLALVAAVLEDHGRAAQLFAKADAVRDTLGLPLAPPERVEHSRHQAVVHAALGDAAFAAACAEGRAMALEQAIEYALNAPDPDVAQLSRRNVPTGSG